jgi:hypothetical protein
VFAARHYIGLIALLAILTGCSGGKRSEPDADGDKFADAVDCAPSDASRWQQLGFQSRDADSDGHWANSAGQVCSGAAVPPTYSSGTAPAGDIDCDDTSSSHWRLLPHTSRDADGDGFSIASTGEACSGTSLRVGYGTTAPVAEFVDCDDADREDWRFMATYRDQDGDGIGSGPNVIACIGPNAPAGFSLYGYDPLDVAGDPNSVLTSNQDLPVWLLKRPD